VVASHSNNPRQHGCVKNVQVPESRKVNWEIYFAVSPELFQMNWEGGKKKGKKR